MPKRKTKVTKRPYRRAALYPEHLRVSVTADTAAALVSEADRRAVSVAEVVRMAIAKGLPAVRRRHNR